SRRHTRFSRDWSSDVCSSDLVLIVLPIGALRSLVGVLLICAVVGGINTLTGHDTPSAGGGSFPLPPRATYRLVALAALTPFLACFRGTFGIILEIATTDVAPFFPRFGSALRVLSEVAFTTLTVSHF